MPNYFIAKKNIYKKTKIYTKFNIKIIIRDFFFINIELFRVLQTIYEILYQFIIFE